MSIKQNFPAIKPTLNLDFANSKAVDSRVTFTRASGATYTNAQGVLQTLRDNKPRIDFDATTGECRGLLIEESRTNLFGGIYGSGQAITIIPNATISPDGTYNAIKVITPTTTNYHGVQTMTPNIPAGSTDTISFYVKKADASGDTPNSVYVEWNPSFTTAGVWKAATWNINTAAVSSSSTGVTASITYVGNGWYRCIASLTNNTSSTQSGTNIIYTYAGGYTAGDGVTGIYIWGTQREIASFASSFIPPAITFTSRASSATYFDSIGVMRIAPANSARYGYAYDSTTGKWVAQGLVLESAATNYLSYSDIANSRTANFYVGGNAVDLGIVAGPDGTMSARRLKSNAASNSYFNTVIPSLPAGTYTFSVWVRLNAGTPTNSIAYSSAYGNGWAMNAVPTSTWQRVYGTYTTGSNQTNVVLTLPYYDSPANCEIDYAWLQMETGSVPTSYIPTYGSSATRAADVYTSPATTRAKDSAQLIGTNFSSWYNQSESTIYTEADILGVSTSGSWAGDIYCFGSNGVEAISAGINNTTPSVYAGRSAVGGATLFTATYNTPFKIAQSFNKSTTYHYASGNGSATQGPLGYGVPYQDSLTIGDSPNVSLRTMSGHIKKLTYYPKAVTAAQLQALTV